MHMPIQIHNGWTWIVSKEHTSFSTTTDCVRSVGSRSRHNIVSVELAYKIHLTHNVRYCAATLSNNKYREKIETKMKSHNREGAAEIRKEKAELIEDSWALHLCRQVERVGRGKSGGGSTRERIGRKDTTTTKKNSVCLSIYQYKSPELCTAAPWNVNSPSLIFIHSRCSSTLFFSLYTTFRDVDLCTSPIVQGNFSFFFCLWQGEQTASAVLFSQQKKVRGSTCSVCVCGHEDKGERGERERTCVHQVCIIDEPDMRCCRSARPS